MTKDSGPIRIKNWVTLPGTELLTDKVVAECEGNMASNNYWPLLLNQLQMVKTAALSTYWFINLFPLSCHLANVLDEAVVEHP